MFTITTIHRVHNQHTHAYTQTHQVAPLHKRLAEISFLTDVYHSVRREMSNEMKERREEKKNNTQNGHSNANIMHFCKVCVSMRFVSCRSFVRSLIHFVHSVRVLYTNKVCEEQRDVFVIVVKWMYI